MDKGRQIDNTQNVNARFIDNFGANQKTSVRTTNPPGGKSSFSLGWDVPEETKPKKKVVTQNNTEDYNDRFSGSNNNNNNYGKKSVNNAKPNNDNMYNNQNQNVKNAYTPYDNQEQNSKEKTSVKVKYAPGGKSNFSLGYDNVNYDDYKKNI